MRKKHIVYIQLIWWLVRSGIFDSKIDTRILSLYLPSSNARRENEGLVTCHCSLRDLVKWSLVSCLLPKCLSALGKGLPDLCFSGGRKLLSPRTSKSGYKLQRLLAQVAMANRRWMIIHFIGSKYNLVLWNSVFCYLTKLGDFYFLKNMTGFKMAKQFI